LQTIVINNNDKQYDTFFYLHQQSKLGVPQSPIFYKLPFQKQISSIYSLILQFYELFSNFETGYFITIPTNNRNERLQSLLHYKKLIISII